MELVYAKPLVEALREELSAGFAAVRERGVTPRLVAVVAADDPAVASYAGAKAKQAKQYGVEFSVLDLGSNPTQRDVDCAMRNLSDDKDCHGVILELPLAPGLNPDRAMDQLHPSKDVDGLTATNMGLAASGREDEAILAATAQACIQLAEQRGPLDGRNVAVIGKGRTVGRPLYWMLLNRHSTVTVCHSHTFSLKDSIKNSAVVFIGIGMPKFLKAEHVQEGQFLVDAGISSLDGKICGDVDAESVESVVSALTPVPGGVGPLTSAILFKNLLKGIHQQLG